MDQDLEAILQQEDHHMEHDHEHQKVQIDQNDHIQTDQDLAAQNLAVVQKLLVAEAVVQEDQAHVVEIEAEDEVKKEKTLMQVDLFLERNLLQV
jgi:hypothetical protein